MEEKKELKVVPYQKPKLEIIVVDSDVITSSSDCNFPAHDPNTGTWI